ncbi:MAG: beta-lactamase family protein [Gemmatimonadetes bacterium]|nr:beta-lactamase family protein [Gemmatimonadota bacterium]
MRGIYGRCHSGDRGRERSARAVPACATLLCVLVAAALLFTSCGTRELEPSLQVKVEKVADRLMGEYRAPGVIIGVWSREQGDFTLVRGLADVKSREPMDAGLAFRAGSITKTFTGNVVLQLVDEGRVGLDDPVDRYVRGVPGGGEITVRMLLNNTSGLFNYGEDEQVIAELERNPERKWTPRELVEVATSHPPYFPPGEGCYYSNTNYVLLGMMIEKVTGRTFAEEVNARVAETVGLADTYVAEGTGLEGVYSHGYGLLLPDDEELADLTNHMDTSIVWSAGAAVSSMEDLRMWAAVLAEGELLEPGTVREMKEWVDLPGAEGVAAYGLGVMKFGDFIGHDGMFQGYNAAMFHLPEEDATIVVFANVSDASDPALLAFLQIAKDLFPGHVTW